ncbi:hypothetical protein EC9_43260 [Rosistilla ulvae]|uniref:Uncharacterized protein n=1 Tax=Rosistilla ulvae TaxID=1930277 RepID=A0A517M5G6_9BACT|nr:hypothetical protein EC9_43260 [Rosistilla ulvae]
MKGLKPQSRRSHKACGASRSATILEPAKLRARSSIFGDSRHCRRPLLASSELLVNVALQVIYAPG